ncbi:MAG: hypothetical protein Q8P42_16750, partial [Gallionella sp.]|nr:hypothetical protein [Gallionella sp.]
GISHMGADFIASILPDGLHDAEIWGVVPLSIGKEPSFLAGCDNRISTVTTIDRQLLLAFGSFRRHSQHTLQAALYIGFYFAIIRNFSVTA